MPRVCGKFSWIDNREVCIQYDKCVRVAEALTDLLKQVEKKTSIEAVVARIGGKLLSSSDIICEDSNIMIVRVFKGG
jgi:sulfur carrier protein ThiS